MAFFALNKPKPKRRCKTPQPMTRERALEALGYVTRKFSLHDINVKFGYANPDASTALFTGMGISYTEASDLARQGWKAEEILSLTKRFGQKAASPMGEILRRLAEVADDSKALECVLAALSAPHDAEAMGVVKALVEWEQRWPKSTIFMSNKEVIDSELALDDIVERAKAVGGKL